MSFPNGSPKTLSQSAIHLLQLQDGGVLFSRSWVVALLSLCLAGPGACMSAAYGQDDDVSAQLEKLLQGGDSGESSQSSTVESEDQKMETDDQPNSEKKDPKDDSKKTTKPEEKKDDSKTAVAKPFDGDTAWKHLVEICKIGPRVSASRGMQLQQQYLEKHFKDAGGTFLTQQFQAASPYNRSQVALHNVIVQFHPDRKRRLLICCHYDTRPFADRDRRNPRAPFIGANDGGSGVALLCELGQHLKDMEGIFGVDLVFFDGEEFVIDSRNDPMFLGSTYFAQAYAGGQIPWRYDYGILVDMVADKNLQIYFEKNSLKPGPDRLSRSIWGVAQRLGVREFIPQARHEVRDDHLPLNNIAGIPTVDIIDFDYPNPRLGNAYWHTQQDNIGNCSRDSLHKVGTVLLAWLREMQAAHAKPTAAKTSGQ